MKKEDFNGISKLLFLPINLKVNKTYYSLVWASPFYNVKRSWLQD